jgi:coenzyme F420-reducing hydrogenase delta subunit
MGAIQLEHFTDENMLAQIKQEQTPHSLTMEEHFIPRIVVFCCKHSGDPAMKLAAHMGYTLPVNLQAIEVPCAGKIDPDYILKSFEHGADGVIIMACHEGNCFSEQGNTYAAQRVAVVKELLKETGFEKSRLIFKHIASNMGSEFFNTVQNAKNQIKALGPNPLVSL